MLVKIERYYDYPDIKRQTPGGSLIWKDYTFTESKIDECDYLVILDYPKDDFTVKVNPNKIISFCLEPPNEVSKYRQYSNKNVAVIYNQLDIQKNNVLSHGALPWHIDKDYDFLQNLNRDDLVKENKIVWITSNQRSSKGHEIRMNFLDSIKNLTYVNLYGRGINPIQDKWEVLKSAKYAIAYENFQNEFYWTEKVADCFLSFTMPIYFGCTQLENYFPKNSFIQLDPKDKHISLFLKEVVSSNKWEENRVAIEAARNLVLNEYQLFPFLYNQIKALESAKGCNISSAKEVISFKGKDVFFDNYPFSVTLEKQLAKIQRKLKRL